MSHTEDRDFPKIAIIGRPNVGKSSLFNRILRRRKAIIESQAGVTRDRLYAHIRLRGIDLIIIDTGGILTKPKEKIAQAVYKQSSEAIAESDAVIFLCDVRSGITYQDEHVASLLKKSGKRSFLAVNKVDDDNQKSEAFDFYKLGLGKPNPISALHGKGLDELFKEMVAYISAAKGQRVDSAQPIKAGLENPVGIKIAIVGRPNVGKSSFINCLLDKERLVVDEMPGTTRDSIEVFMKRDKSRLIIIDTAGMKHKKKLRETVEVFSLARAKESVRCADIALVVIDVMVGLTRDDIAVIDYVIKQGRACVLAVNKCDLVNGLDAEDYRKKLRGRLRPLEWIPVIFTSCKQKKNIIKAIDTAREVVKASRAVVSTPKINRLLVRLQNKRPHPSFNKVRPRILYATQTNTLPPAFLLFCTNPRLIKYDYLRFLENSIRKEFGFYGIPISFKLRGRE